VSASTAARAAQPIRANLLAFLERKTRQQVGTGTDLFKSGLVSSMFALELVVHVESEFGITIEGPDLTLDNFRTVDAMTELVLRLRGGLP
jgi:methoxymalonate biosynthesis acyl carrier protein